MKTFADQVLGLPEQLTTAPYVEGDPVATGGRLWIAGMGGSGWAGELLLRRRPGRDVVVLRDLELPPTATGDALIAISHSGNTVETLGVWEEAGRRGLTRAAVTSGGELLQRARAAGAPVARVPDDHAPRTALGFLLRAAAALDAGIGEWDWEAEADCLRRVRKDWAESDPRACDRVAERLRDGWTAVAAFDDTGWDAAGRWVADLAENAKQPAAVWALPEAAHNLVMTAARDAPRAHDVRVCALGPPPAHARTMWEAVRATLGDHGAEVIPVDIEHDDPWTRMLAHIFVGGLVSLALARLTGVDPAPLSLMDDLKRRRAAGKDDDAS